MYDITDMVRRYLVGTIAVLYRKQALPFFLVRIDKEIGRHKISFIAKYYYVMPWLHTEMLSPNTVLYFNSDAGTPGLVWWSIGSKAFTVTRPQQDPLPLHVKGRALKQSRGITALWRTVFK